MEKRELTVYYSFNGRKEIPCIRLQGQWLKSYGFKVGDKLKVFSGDGTILIELKKEDIIKAR